jgi:glycosyltransferase-like protein
MTGSAAGGVGRGIALLTYSTKPRGGVVHTLALAEALARCGADVTVWSLARGGDEGFFRPVDPAVHLRLAPFPAVDDESVGRRVLRSIAVLCEAFGPEADSYDVVHAEDCISANAALASRSDVVRTVHHLDKFTTPELVSCHEKAIRDSAAHVCVSGSVAGELRAGFDLQPEVIANGVDAARFEAAADDDPIAVYNRERWTERFGRYVLSVGGIEPRKGTMDLVEAMALLRDLGHDVPLVLAGGDTLFDYREYRSAVGRRAAELDLRPVVLGPVPHDDLPSLVAGAGAFAFPSRQEGFGLAAMEALAAGVPLVTRDIPVMHEIFGTAASCADDPAGFARALAEALEAGDRPERDRARILAGRALAEEHSWDTAARAHLLFYERLLDEGVLSARRDRVLSGTAKSASAASATATSATATSSTAPRRKD